MKVHALSLDAIQGRDPATIEKATSVLTAFLESQERSAAVMAQMLEAMRR